MITQEELKEILYYDSETGLFTRKTSVASNKIKIGSIAGCKNNIGYIQIHINYELYLAHRLAWLYKTGNWPKNDIDHINGIRNDNRFCNLREATRSQNRQNSLLSSKNTSGITGVCWYKNSKKFAARISINGKTKTIGFFKELEDAKNARIEFANLYYKEFHKLIL